VGADLRLDAPGELGGKGTSRMEMTKRPEASRMAKPKSGTAPVFRASSAAARGVLARCPKNGTHTDCTLVSWSISSPSTPLPRSVRSMSLAAPLLPRQMTRSFPSERKRAMSSVVRGSDASRPMTAQG